MFKLSKRLVAAATVTVLLLAGAASANADDLDDRRAQAERKQAEILDNREQLQSELEGTDAELAQAALDLQTIEARLPVAQAELAAAQAELERTEREAAQLAQRLDDALDEESSISDEIASSAGKVSEAKSSIAEMARMAYRGEGDVSSLGIVTGVQSTEEFIEQYSMSSTAARSQSRSLEELQQEESISRNREARLKAVRETIGDLKDEADQNVVAADAAKDDAAARKTEVEHLIAQQTAKKATIEDRKEAALAANAANEQAANAQTAELKEIIAQQRERDQKAAAAAAAAAEAARKAAEEANKPKPPSTGGGGGGETSTGGGGGGGAQVPGRGFLAYPTAVPHITSNYGERFHPIFHRWMLHAGTDFRAYCGTPVMAAAAGTVLFSRVQSTGNRQVLIDHGWVDGVSLMTSYNHLTTWSVSPGQKVSKGQVVGYSGNTGVSAACHLHFEVYINGDTVDPMTRL